jgi:predicted SprT family Zn-dependent metalloprotease
MEHWSELWGCQGLAERVTVRTDRRLRSSIARTSVSKLEIRLHPELESAPEDFTTEVVCHELAHLACHHLHGAGHAPHGAEWRHLIELAGFRPATGMRVPREGAAGTRRVAETKVAQRVIYTHTCPVCHFSRTARRAMPRWRCPECAAAGLGGELQVESVPARGR